MVFGGEIEIVGKLADDSMDVRMEAQTAGRTWRAAPAGDLGSAKAPGSRRGLPVRHRPTDRLGDAMRCDAMRGGSLVGRGAAPGPHRGLLGQSREERTKPTSRPDMSGCTSSCTVLYNGTVQCLQYCRRGERDHETCPLYE